MFTLILLSSCASCKPDSAPEISHLASALEVLGTQVSKEVALEEQQDQGEEGVFKELDESDEELQEQDFQAIFNNLLGMLSQKGFQEFSSKVDALPTNLKKSFSNSPQIRVKVLSAFISANQQYTDFFKELPSSQKKEVDTL